MFNRGKHLQNQRDQPGGEHLFSSRLHLGRLGCSLEHMVPPPQPDVDPMLSRSPTPGHLPCPSAPLPKGITQTSLLWIQSQTPKETRSPREGPVPAAYLPTEDPCWPSNGSCQPGLPMETQLPTQRLLSFLMSCGEPWPRKVTWSWPLRTCPMSARKLRSKCPPGPVRGVPWVERVGKLGLGGTSCGVCQLRRGPHEHTCVACCKLSSLVQTLWNCLGPGIPGCPACPG